MKIKPTRKNDGLILTLTTDEAVRLEAIIGRLNGNACRCFPFYDDIADALEESGQVDRISRFSEHYNEHFVINCYNYSDDVVLDYPEGY